MENAYLPKISILLQFGGEILALLFPGDSTQILLSLSQFKTLRTETKLEGFVWSHQGITELISPSPSPTERMCLCIILMVSHNPKFIYRDAWSSISHHRSLQGRWRKNEH